jgi:hypothetical protein
MEWISRPRTLIRGMIELMVEAGAPDWDMLQEAGAVFVSPKCDCARSGLAPAKSPAGFPLRRDRYHGDTKA